MHDICEVVNTNSLDFCWISTIGYISITFWKMILGQNPYVALVWFMQWAKMAFEHGEKTGIGA